MRWQPKKLVEFNGTNWHADPKRYKPNFKFKEMGGLKAKERWKIDRRRLRILKKNGYKVLVIWQRELRNRLKLKRKILRFVKCGSV